MQEVFGCHLHQYAKEQIPVLSMRFFGLTGYPGSRYTSLKYCFCILCSSVAGGLIKVMRIVTYHGRNTG